MRLATFIQSGMPRIGVMAGEEIVDLLDYDASLPTDMSRFIALGAPGLQAAGKAVALAHSRLALDTVRLTAPVSLSGKIFGIGMNFSSFLDAARRCGMTAAPGQRIWFNRQRTCVVGPADDIWMPRASQALDYEGELAIVIGSRCRHLTSEQARRAIAGYTICNDLTVRDWAARCPLLGKSFDTHAPMGPWLVTPDELGDPHELTITTTVNGQIRQHGSTAEMLTNCFELIAELSAITTLEPGDIILTGTPDGCAVLSQPARFLRTGDCVCVSIDGIGEIANAVIPEMPVEIAEPVS